MKHILQQNAWFGNEPCEIELPDNWDITVHGIKGDNMPALTKEQIREKINKPYGMPTIRELAKGKEEVAIIFDDISRGTPTQIMAEVVLEELHGAGIKKENIRFICALGTHGAHSRVEFVAKLGADIVRDYMVFNHNSYENNVEIGVTKRGFPVKINAEFMKCDLKIGLGAIVPHPFNGFGGGGKMLFPGLGDITTVHQNHKTAVDAISAMGSNPLVLTGKLENDGMRTEIEEMTRMVGEFFKIDAIYNTRLEVVDIFAGDPVEEYYAGVEVAKELYKTEKVVEKDIVIANANAKTNESAIALFFGAMGVKTTGGGDLVLVNHSTIGQAPHYLMGAFGKMTGGRMWSNVAREMPHLDRIIFYTPYPDLASSTWFGEYKKIVNAHSWEEVMKLLRERHGDNASVSILEDATIQYFE